MPELLSWPHTFSHAAGIVRLISLGILVLSCKNFWYAHHVNCPLHPVQLGQSMLQSDDLAVGGQVGSQEPAMVVVEESEVVDVVA